MDYSKILNRFKRKNKVYKNVFNTPSGEEVLRDLAKFCGQNSSTYVSGDSHASAYREGMRRVFLRIQNFIEMDEQDMSKLLKQQEKEF